MAKYSIAWMPGDGIGNDVMEATRIVLDAMKLDAEYVPCDIGWEFWCREGNPLPDRSIKVLQSTTCGLFGAITSKPQDEAKEELQEVVERNRCPPLGPVVPPGEHADHARTLGAVEHLARVSVHRDSRVALHLDVERADAANVAVVDGLQDGERVVTEGASLLSQVR